MCAAVAGVTGLCIVLGGCNGPFGGSVRVMDTNDQPFASGGRRASMSADVRWDFVRVDQKAAWTLSDGSRLTVMEAVRKCEAACSRYRPGEYARRDFYSGNSVMHRTTRVVVCIEPLVVVETPIASVSENEADGPMVDASSELLPLAPGRVIAPLGYRYGTRVPYHDKVMWFSPAIATTPRDALQIGDERIITVPWGELVLRRAGEEWAVTARVPKK